MLANDDVRGLSQDSGSPFGDALLQAAKASREEYSGFHEQATFLGVWLLVVLVGVHTMQKMRDVLEPLLWAFFLMMALVPLASRIERLLIWLGNCCWVLPQQLLRRFRGGGGLGERVAVADDDDSSSAADTEQDCRGVLKDHCGTNECGFARIIAVVVVIILFVGANAAFGIVIYKSAWHMQQEMHYYKQGAGRIQEKFYRLKDSVPTYIIETATSKALTVIEYVVENLVATVADLPGVMFKILMVLLYMVFWLCEPVHVGKRVPELFKRYIILKGAASASYAFCIWCLLHYLGVDLAIVFGLITCVFNFVPEVGPFLAMLLPIPLILFDGRLKDPVVKCSFAFGGQLLLKFIFANIVEVMLVGTQDDMKMHPVVILFFVAFFGWIWGGTGMLLSVPIMATIKALVPGIPAKYRNAVLIMLEGDKEAPVKYEKKHTASRQSGR